MVEIHLLSVNVDFQYDPFYALGVVTAYDSFMKGYRPEADIESIFSALCQSTETPPADQYRRDAEQLKSKATQLSQSDLDAIVSQLGEDTATPEADSLHGILHQVLKAGTFKYSRLFAIGLLTVLEAVDDTLVADETVLSEWLGKLGGPLNLPQDKMAKDLELYRSNLEKMRQAQIVLEEAIAADRKKRAEREQASKTAGADEQDASTDDAESSSSEPSEQSPETTV